MRVIDSNCIKQPRIAKLESMEETYKGILSVGRLLFFGRVS